MKIGILTFINTLNFGASLQTYALQKTLESMGAQAEIIRYVNRAVEDREKKTGKKNLKKLFSLVRMGRALRRKEAAFRRFEAEHIRFGAVLTPESAKQTEGEYDLFVTGSDQVWNQRITGNDNTFFLDFVTDGSKRLSYAPSFGNDVFPEERKKEVGAFLAEFRALSVREKAGARLIRELCGRSAQTVVDPTLLLSKSDWEKEFSFRPKPEHYILVYFPHNKKKVFDFVDKLKAETGLPVIYLSISPRPQRGVTTIYDASPEEFLGWIYHADYVVTGSFHGTAFSLNFEKQFFYEPSGEGSRIGNLVCLTGTRERSIDNRGVLSQRIDYSRVTPLLERERENSLNWLRESIFSENVSEASNIPEVMSEPEAEGAYVAKHRDRETRLHSRSGAVFVAASDMMLSRGGAVYGCVLNDELKAVHIRATDKATRDRMCGSKYIQSDMGNVFSQVRDDLNSGIPVLFTGTGCQAAGLLKYAHALKLNTDRLYTMDIVCHGCPSPKLFAEYAALLENEKGKKVTAFDFRDKSLRGWDGYVESYTMEGEKHPSTTFREIFHTDMCLRPSCYKCHYAKTDRETDITIGDAWGIKKALPDFNDNTGVSLVLVHTEKGRELLDAICNDCEVRKLPLEKMLQPNLLRPSSPKGNREKFWAEYRSGGIAALVQTYGKLPLKKQIKASLKYRLRKLLQSGRYYLP